jgi:hypothetical protein
MAKMHGKQVYRCVVRQYDGLAAGDAGFGRRRSQVEKRLRGVETREHVVIRLWNIKQPDEHAFSINTTPYPSTRVDRIEAFWGVPLYG